MMDAAAHIPPIDEALTDPMLLGAGLGDAASWRVWLTILRAAFGLPPVEGDLAIFAEVAGNRSWPTHRVDELWIIAGRRGGKSRIAGALAAYLASFHTYKLSPGESAGVACLAVNQHQAKAVQGYAGGFLQQSPMLRQLVAGEPTADEIRLAGNISIAVRPANFRSIRSQTLLAAIFDETAFWRDAEMSTNPDSEIYSAVLPGLATTGGMLIGISSPYRRAGLLFSKFEEVFGRDDPDVLVVKAPTRLLNPTLKPEVIERMRRRDPEKARSEWDAEFRGDIADFIDRASLLACVATGTRERPFDRDRIYYAFCDPAGGSGADSMTLAIAHKEGITAVLDVLREVRPRFNPEATVAEFAELLKAYRITKVVGDRYAGDWVASQFSKNGVAYVASERPKSDLYREALPLINSGAVLLLDDARMLGQFQALERRTGRGGRDSIDHPVGAHDDVANVAAGVLVSAFSGVAGRVVDTGPYYSAPMRDPLSDGPFRGRFGEPPPAFSAPMSDPFEELG